MLMQFLLERYKMKEPIIKSDMLKLVNKKYKLHFPEILRRAAERMELVFGLDLKEVKPNGHSYTLVSKLDLSDDGTLSGGWGLPKNGLLMPLLGVIFLNGNRASEEEIWEFLNILGSMMEGSTSSSGSPGSSSLKIWCRKSTWSTARCPTVILLAMSSYGAPKPALKPAR